MSLLDDYEELCNAQDVSIFKGVLDEVLRPILIQLEERYFMLNHRLNDLNDEIKELRGDVECYIKGLDAKIEQELNYAYEVHNTKLHNIWSDVIKIQSDLESIKLNLKK